MVDREGKTEEEQIVAGGGRATINVGVRGRKSGHVGWTEVLGSTGGVL